MNFWKKDQYEIKEKLLLIPFFKKVWKILKKRAWTLWIVASKKFICNYLIYLIFTSRILIHKTEVVIFSFIFASRKLTLAIGFNFVKDIKFECKSITCSVIAGLSLSVNIFFSPNKKFIFIWKRKKELYVRKTSNEMWLRKTGGTITNN